jgi:hypothetical protein
MPAIVEGRAMKNANIAAAESYVLGLKSKDLSRLALAEDVVFKGPLNVDEIHRMFTY